MSSSPPISTSPRVHAASEKPNPSRDQGVKFPEELPISALVREIAQAVAAHPVVIVAGETGSGKTTQLPKICLAMGRGLNARIAVTQPRRIAATSVAARVASELGVELGREVGYQIRFHNKTGPQTYVKFMTDGILLAEIQGDPLLMAYDTLIIDEAHERSLNIDFLLGYIVRLLPKRPDLKVIISSATLETDRFQSFFGGAPIIQVSGRAHSVETIYRPPTRDESDLADTVANTVEEITSLDPREDILVFLPGEREIHETMAALEEHGLPHTVILPLFGRLSQAEQSRVFTTLPERRIVLATNVAETSLTIPGIVYVIDAGLARINRYQARTGVTQLLVEPVSQASADQRKGRAGRTRSGVCFRLYEEQHYTLRPRYTDPELLRVGLAGAILQMKALGLGSIEDFPFLDPAPKRSVDEGYRVLEEIGALDAKRQLTDIGKKLARLPVDPRIGRMILGGETEGALREALVIASALGVQDPRERPVSAQKQADQKHRAFKDESSDFLGLLKLWRFYQDAAGRSTQNQIRKICRDNFLSYMRMREWTDVHQQLSQIVRELSFRVSDRSAKEEAIHRAILPGLLSRVAMWHPENRVYMGARQTRFQLHPSSSLAKKQPPWIVVAELVETSQLFGRPAARIDPKWLEEIAGPLCKHSFGEVSWSERSAEAMIREQVTLYGLPVAKDRRVALAPIDPVAARRLFLVHALVRREMTIVPTPPFMDHNRLVFEEVSALRARARKSDMLADDEAVGAFFESRVPDDVHSAKTFEAWRAVAEQENPRLLYLSPSDVMLDDPDLSPARFPSELTLSGARLSLSYKFDPGSEDDGITLTIPLFLLPQLDPAVLEWTIPGWVEEKIYLLFQSLPKSARKALGALRELSLELSQLLPPFEGKFLATLGQAIFDLVGERIALDAWRLEELPPHLRFYFRVIDGNEMVAEGRDLESFKGRFGGRAREAWAAVPKKDWERDGLTTFDIPVLPSEVPIGGSGARLFGYPAFVDKDTSVSLRLMESREAADEANLKGLRRLIMLALGQNLSKLEQQIPAPVAMSSLSDGQASMGPRKELALRALDEAFALHPQTFPRTKSELSDRIARGRTSLPVMLADLGRAAQEIGLELDKVRAALRALSGGAGAPKSSLDDIRNQLTHMLPPGFLLHTARERWPHLVRYLRAIQVRLERMPYGPQKDQAKAAEVMPFWNDWLTQRQALLSRGVSASDIEAFHWLIEEYRVSIFAPELKTAVPISPQRLRDSWTTLLGKS